MTDNSIKTVYTQDEVKVMMCACLKGINASYGITPAYNSLIYQIITDTQEQFSQILRILNVEYNEICKTVEAYEQDGDDDE